MTRKTEQATTGPAITFATPEAGQQVIARLHDEFNRASQYAQQNGGVAVQLGEDIAAIEADIKAMDQRINELKVQVIEKDGERREAEAKARHGADIAAGYAAMLAAAGVEVSPLGGDLSHNPDTKLANIDAAHAELIRERGRAS